MPLNPSRLSSPQLMEVMMLIKQHNLFEEVHAVLSMNLISRKLIALGALDIVADPRGLQATDIHEAMERAMEAYVREVLEKRRVNCGVGWKNRGAQSFFSISPRFHLMACSSTS